MADYNFGGFRRGALSDVLGPSTTDRIAQTATEIKKRPKQRDTIKASPKSRGALTAAVSDLVRRGSLALGSTERDAVQRAHAFEDANLEWNPLAQADEVGTQARRYVDGDADFNPDALAHGAVGTALTLAPEAGAPILRALSKTKLGGKVRGALSGSQAPLAIDDAIEGTATTISSVPRQRSGPVRTKDGAIPLHGDPRGGALSSPPTETLPVKHFSRKPDLTEVDPRFIGSNRTPGGRRITSTEEINNASFVGGKSYFGVRTGERGGYRRESTLGPFAYDAEIPVHQTLEVGSDNYRQLQGVGREILRGPRSAELKKAWGLPPAVNGATLMDSLAKEAGWKAVRFPSDYSELGELVQSYDKVPVRRTELPVPGQPTNIKGYGYMGPLDPARDTARRYTEAAGIDYQPQSEYLKVDPERGSAIAKAYEEMAHAPQDPTVRSAYAKLAEETLAQYEAIKKTGFKFEFNPEGQAVYEKGPWDAVKDVRENDRMYVYPTDEGYGTGAGITDQDIAENPLLSVVEGETWGGKPVRVNDVFRGVHDYFGHAKDGFGFRHNGEENAWRSHLGMYSPEAQRALTTETRGQNSWLNFGPHGEANRTAKTEDTVFAPQKIGLLPEWVTDPNGMPPQP
jgi:hypothetical protein